MDQLNLDNAEKYADENEEVLQAWLDQIIDGTIELEDGSFYEFPTVSPKFATLVVEFAFFQMLHQQRKQPRRHQRRLETHDERKNCTNKMKKCSCTVAVCTYEIPLSLFRLTSLEYPKNDLICVLPHKPNMHVCVAPAERLYTEPLLRHASKKSASLCGVSNATL